MADAIELMTAFVSIVPSMRGAQGAIAGSLIPDAESAGDSAGSAAGGRFSGAMKRVMGGAALFAGVIAGAKGLYEIGATFDEMSDTIRVGTGAAGDALDGLVASAKKVGSTVPAEFSDIGPVVADINTRFGLTGETLETVAAQYLQAGKILGETVDIGTTSAAFSAFKIEGDGVSAAMDTLFQVSQATGVGMNELASAVQGSAPAMQALGFSFEETTSLVGSLDKAGLNSTSTLAAMSKGLVTLAKDGEEPQEAFRRVTGELQGLVDSGDTAAAIDLASGIFGTKAAVGFVGAVESGTLALDDLVAGTGATSDTILGVADDTASFAETWQILKNKATLALEPLGSKVFSALGDTLEKAMPYFDSLAAWLTDNTWALGVLVGLIGVGLVGAFLALVAPIVATTIAMLASPITWIVVGIMALIAGLVLLIANWDSVVAFLQDVWGGIVDWLAGVWDAITEGISTAWTAVSDFFTGLWEDIKGAFETAWNAVLDFFKKIPGWMLDVFLNFTLAGLLIKHWDSITEGVKTAWNAIVDWVKGIPQRFVDALSAIGNLAGKVGEWIGGVKDKAVEKFQSLIDWVGGIPQKILDGLGNVKELLKEAGKNVIAGFFQGLKDSFEGVKKWVGGVGTWIADHKGPRAYDLALLRPAGGWIMTGLQDSMEDQIPSLTKTLGKVTDAITLNADLRAPNLGPNYASAAMANTFAADGVGAGGMSVTVNEARADPIATATAVVRHIAMGG